MVSYIKTQWFMLVGALAYLAISIFNFCDGNELWGIAWGVVAVIWFLCSILDYYKDRIELLEKKSKKYDACCSLVEELIKANEALVAANEADRQYADYLNRKLESFILESKEKKQ